MFAGIGFGRLHRYVPAFVLIYIGGIIAGGLTLFLIFWNRVPNYYAVIGYSIGWGICDGVWQSLVSGMIFAIIIAKCYRVHTQCNLNHTIQFQLTVRMVRNPFTIFLIM